MVMGHMPQTLWQAAICGKRVSTATWHGQHFAVSLPLGMQLFSKAGDIKRLIMGLDAHKRTPCGFCFVSYFTRKDAEAAVKYINGSMMDSRAIRVDHDWGYIEGRQFGRGRSGGQVGPSMQSMALSSCNIPECSRAEHSEHSAVLHSMKQAQHGLAWRVET